MSAVSWLLGPWGHWQELEACGDEKAKVKEERLSCFKCTERVCGFVVMECEECDKALEQAAASKKQSESRDAAVWRRCILC